MTRGLIFWVLALLVWPTFSMAQTATCVTAADGSQICQGYAGSGAPVFVPGAAYGHPTYAPTYNANINRNVDANVNRGVDANVNRGVPRAGRR